MEGYGNNLFGTNDNITREQIATLIKRYSEGKNLSTTARSGLEGYTDVAQVSSWALDAMKWANAENLIKGRTTTTLDPKGETTRAEAATLLMRFIEDYLK